MTKRKTAPRARYTMEFKLEAVRLVEGGPTNVLFRQFRCAIRSSTTQSLQPVRAAISRRLLHLQRSPRQLGS